MHWLKCENKDIYFSVTWEKKQKKCRNWIKSLNISYFKLVNPVDLRDANFLQSYVELQP